MGDVEDEPKPLHLSQQLASLDAHVTGRVGAVCVSSRPVVCGSYGPQSLRVRSLEMRGRQNRIGAFEAEDVANRFAIRGSRFAIRPSLDMPVQTGTIANLHQLAALFHRPVPRELSLRHRPSLIGWVPSWERAAWRDVAGNLRRHAQADAAAPHLGKGHRSVAAIGLVGESSLARANLVDGTSEIAIPLDRVHRQI